MQQVPPGCAIFVPTLHDENTAYLPAYKYSARRAKELFWLTEAEQRVGTKLWGDLPGRVISMSIDVEPREPAAAATRYLLYCGRVDPNKGCGELFDYFIKFKRTFPTRLRLIVTGTKEMEIPSHSDIEFLGFVSAEEKLRLMAGATVYMMPSKNESLSIVTLEAMAQSTPVLANGGSAVLVDHISRSGAGRIYIDYEGFAASLSEMLSADGNAEEMGAAGREYVLSRYQLAAIRKALVEAVESCI
jgi:glycosyltransferase involved in cell wall biosynthesis